MSELAIQVGSTVKLKSGGPTMTVKYVDAVREVVTCQWFERGRLNQGMFPPGSLEVV